MSNEGPTRYHNLGWFGQHPGIYDVANTLIIPIRKWAIRLMQENVQSDHDLHILEIACGTGAQSVLFAEEGYRVVGVDLDPTMVLKAKLKLSEALPMCFQVGNGTDLPYRGKVFDLVAICFALHDIPYGVGIQLLNEARRVLNQNGMVMIIDYNEPAKALAARALTFIAKTYESPNYLPFLRHGLSSYIDEADLAVCHRSDFLGMVQFVLLSKRLGTSRRATRTRF